MKKKRYSDISFLPAFLVPSTVMKFLCRWRPVDCPPRSVLTVSYKGVTIRKSANPFIFRCDHTHIFIIFFIILNVALWLVSSKGNQTQYTLI